MSRAARHPALDDRIRFARRTVTREALVASEDHDSLDEAGFAGAEAAGAFSLVWAAHGGCATGCPARSSTTSPTDAPSSPTCRDARSAARSRCSGACTSSR